MPLALPSQFSPGKALLEQEQGAAPCPASTGKSWALQLQRIPPYSWEWSSFYPLQGMFETPTNPKLAWTTNGWLASWLSSKFSTFFGWTWGKRSWPAAWRVNCEQEKETKQSSQICCAHIIWGWLMGLTFLGTKFTYTQFCLAALSCDETCRS